MPGELWVEPHDAIAANGEIRGIEHSRLDEAQDDPINLGPLRLNQIEHEFRRSVSAFVHDANGGVVAVGNRLDPMLALKDRIGVIQDRIDRVRRIAIARQMKWRRALLD